MGVFIGRKMEMQELEAQSRLKVAAFVVMNGRRRIGKTRLLLEYSKFFEKIFIFSGLPPSVETTARSQRDEFLRQLIDQLKRNLGIELSDKDISAEDWGDLFSELSQYTKTGKVLIVLDEVGWIGSKDPLFLGKLKNAWDLYFKQNDQLVLAISGSASSWIEKNILSSTGFMGRITLEITLNELSLFDCMQFWGDKNNYISFYDKFKVLSVIGGVPRYLEAIDPMLSAEENIKRLCFTTSGILYREFERIFSDLFSSKNKLYQKIVKILVTGSAEQKTICAKLGIKYGGDIAEYLNDLVKAGFVARDFTWNIKNGQFSRLSKYRLKDNYTRFYLKYILPNKPKVESNGMREISLVDFPGWDSIMGLQFENFVLNNRQLIKKALNIPMSDIVFDNPYFQNKTVKQKGCQIDYLIQTKLNSLYVCEIKFSRNKIDSRVIQEVREKISKLKTHMNFSYWPVLIHVNGVSESVEEEGYFAKIINFSELIEAK